MNETEQNPQCGAAVIYQNQTFDFFALFLTVISLFVLFRFKIDVLRFVLGGGVLGFIKLLAAGRKFLLQLKKFVYNHRKAFSKKRKFC